LGDGPSRSRVQTPLATASHSSDAGRELITANSRLPGGGGRLAAGSGAPIYRYHPPTPHTQRACSGTVLLYTVTRAPPLQHATWSMITSHARYT